MKKRAAVARALASIRESGLPNLSHMGSSPWAPIEHQISGSSARARATAARFFMRR